jgi:hypothetical protein
MKSYLKKSNTLASADGKPLQELGKAIFDIQLGDLNFDIELIVADIEVIVISVNKNIN